MLSDREDAGTILNGLEQQTSLVTAEDGLPTAYRVEELLRTNLCAELHRRARRGRAG